MCLFLDLIIYEHLYQIGGNLKVKSSDKYSNCFSSRGINTHKENISSCGSNIMDLVSNSPTPPPPPPTLAPWHDLLSIPCCHLVIFSCPMTAYECLNLSNEHDWWLSRVTNKTTIMNFRAILPFCIWVCYKIHMFAYEGGHHQ